MAEEYCIVQGLVIVKRLWAESTDVGAQLKWNSYLAQGEGQCGARMEWNNISMGVRMEDMGHGDRMEGNDSIGGNHGKE